MSNSLLFIACSFIWGTTWIAINYQIGEMAPALAVAIRFSIAALILGAWCWHKRLSMRFEKHLHYKLLLLGIFFYTLDYSLLYAAQHHIISALLALLSSTIIYVNVVLRRILLGKPIRMEVVIGATFGMFGIGLIFIPEFESMSLQEGILIGLLLAMGSFLSASIGNIISERIFDQGMPVVQVNFFAMAYSLPFTYSFALYTADTIQLPSVLSFYLALLYLAVFGSVLAFGAYMKLIQQIGSDKAAYTVLVYPLVALLISTVFEGYQWQVISAVGVLAVLFGNAIAMGKLNTYLGLSKAR